MPKFHIPLYNIHPDETLNNLHLYPMNAIEESECILYCIDIPEEMNIASEKDYFIVNSECPLYSIKHTIQVRRNGIWEEMPELQHLTLKEMENVLTKLGYHLVPELGYLTAKEFRNWFRKLHPEFFRKQKLY